MVLSRRGDVGRAKIVLDVPDISEDQLILRWAKGSNQAGKSSCYTSKEPECGVASLGQDWVQRKW